MQLKNYFPPVGKIFSAHLIIFLLSAVTFAQTISLDRKSPQFPADARGGTSEPRQPVAADKLAPELQILSEQFTATRGDDGAGARENGIGGYTARQLQEIFGLTGNGAAQTVNLAIETTAPTNIADLKKAGANIFLRSGNLVYAGAPIAALANLSRLASVKHIGLLKPSNVPRPPKPQTVPTFDFPARGGAAKPPAANEFNKQTLTGKNVIIGVIDSGIDWTHPDFIRADGTSRVLLLWDATDDSWETSGGGIGTGAPLFGENNARLPGTIYTNAQINHALKGTGKVNSTDKVGHGTAVAGTAGGNGRGATGGILPDAVRGVAPDADFIIVKIGDCEDSAAALAAIGAFWTAVEAKNLKRPLVINLSLGTQYSTHDGTNSDEKLLDSISDPVNGFGVPIVVAAGNEGRLSLHAGGRFGARKPGQSDTTSPPIEVFVNQPSLLLGTFAVRDEWGIFFRSTNQMFQGADGKPVGVYFFKRGGNIEYETDAPVADRENFDKFVQTFRHTTQENTDSVVLQLPEGQYLLFGFGVSEKVFDGKFSFYLPNQEGASFGLGTEKKFMVGSPGNATKVITVGSTDFRSEWENRDGQISQFNLGDGELSDYSSPGPRRDGVTKPEIVAPGRYTIASLSKFSIPENGGCKSSLVASADLQKVFITKSRNHVAWSGTSASTPFVAGVIALMLQKNPNLKAEQIKQILIKTASGRIVNGRAVNDERLGYGRIEPAAALKNVPAPTRPAPKKK